MKKPSKTLDLKNCRLDIFTIIAWLYVLGAATLYIRSNFIDNFLQLFFLLILFVLSLMINKSFKINKVIITYGFLLLSAFIPDIINFDIRGIYTGITTMLPVLFFLFFYNAYSQKQYLPTLLITIPICYGTVVSIQGIVLEIIKFLDFSIETNAIWVEKAGVIQEYAAYGLGGLASWGNVAGHSLWRLYGYFIEPSKFAAFLLLPICFSMGEYKKTHHKRYFIAFILMFICFTFTMSRAGYISLISAVIFYRIIKRKISNGLNDKFTNLDMIKLLLVVVAIIAGAFFLLITLLALSKYFPSISMLSAGIVDETGHIALIRPETVNKDLIFYSLVKQPYGYGFSHLLHGYKDIDTNLANAFVHWIFIGGIAGAIGVVIFIWQMLTEYCIPCIKSSDPIKVSIAVAFVALTIHGLSYGNWISPDYIFMVGLLILIKEKCMNIDEEEKRVV